MTFDFAELKKRFQTRAAVAITLESDRIAIAFLRKENGGERVVHSLSLPLGADDVLKAPAAAGTELATALSAAGIRERRCVVCVPPGWALTASTDLPEVNPDDLRSFFELCAERELPVAVSDVRLAHSAYSLPDGKQRATLAALPAKRMDAIEKMLDAAGCRAVSISLALDQCLADPAATLHFLANGTHTDAIITAGGGVVALRSLAGPRTTEDSIFDPAAFCREIRITLGRLPESVRQQVRTARFIGNASSAEKLRLYIGDQLDRMGIENREEAAGDADLAGIEAARRFLREEPVAFEFFVRETHPWQEMLQRFDTKRHRWIGGAAVGLIFLPLIAFFIRSQMESHFSNQWEGMKKNVAELDAIQQKIRRFRPWFEPAPQALQVLDSLIAAFPEQGDVWAKGVQIGEGYKVTCSGLARNQAALSGLLDRLRGRPDITGVSLVNLRGENPIQFSVTYKWEPRHEN